MISWTCEIIYKNMFKSKLLSQLNCNKSRTGNCCNTINILFRKHLCDQTGRATMKIWSPYFLRIYSDYYNLKRIMNCISSIQKFSKRRRVPFNSPDFQSFIIIWVFYLEILDFSPRNNSFNSTLCFDDVSIICKEMKTNKKMHIKLHSLSFPLFISHSQVMIPFTVQLYPISALTNALLLLNWSPWRFEPSTAVSEASIAAGLMPEGLQIVNASTHMQPVSVRYVVYISIL